MINENPSKEVNTPILTLKLQYFHFFCFQFLLSKKCCFYFKKPEVGRLATLFGHIGLLVRVVIRVLMRGHCTEGKDDAMLRRIGSGRE
jgi:hypothetical protein